MGASQSAGAQVSLASPGIPSPRPHFPAFGAQGRASVGSAVRIPLPRCVQRKRPGLSLLASSPLVASDGKPAQTQPRLLAGIHAPLLLCFAPSPAGGRKEAGGSSLRLSCAATPAPLALCSPSPGAPLPTDLPGGRRNGVGDMAGTTVKIEGTEVALGAPGGNVVNITLHQESGMAYLFKGAASFIRRRAAAKDAASAPSTRRPRRGEQKALGVAQILLGAICIGIGVALSMAQPNDYIPYYYKRAIDNGVPFWSGSLFILSGTFSAVGAQHSGNWVHLATFLNLGSFVAGSVAYTVGLTEFPSPTYKHVFIERLCKHTMGYENYEPWEPTPSPPYDNPKDQERDMQCQEALRSLVHMWSATHILLLILHSVALLIALFCFGYGLHRLCCSCWGGCQDYMAMEDADASEELGKEQNPA